MHPDGEGGLFIVKSNIFKERVVRYLTNLQIRIYATFLRRSSTHLTTNVMTTPKFAGSEMNLEAATQLVIHKDTKATATRLEVTSS